jgi:hypothetical protein
MTPTVKELRQSGKKVRVTHYRYLPIVVEKKNQLFVQEILTPMKEIRADGLGHRVSPFGGVTEVWVTDGQKEFYGVAECCETDLYNNKLGVKMATQRALESIGLTK